jgi:rod shape-determining protein MreD
MLALVLAAALLDGPDRGAAWGFAAGIAYDLVLDTPFGLSALTYAVVGYLAGMVGAAMVRPAGWWPVVIAGVWAAIAVAFYAVVGNLVGVGNPLDGLWQVALVVAAWSAALVLPLRALLRRLFGRTEPDRIAVAFRGPSMKGVS